MFKIRYILKKRPFYNYFERIKDIYNYLQFNLMFEIFF